MPNIESLSEENTSGGCSPEASKCHTICQAVKVNIGSKSFKKISSGKDDTFNSKTQQNYPSATQPTKIVRNYAKVLCTFACSGMSLPYLKKIVDNNYKNTVEIEDFQDYIRNKKEQATSILSLRSLLLIDVNDEEVQKLYKKVFADISVIFLKFYAVNWIFNGKVKHKIEHLKCRHKMIRRVRNPELFTFLRG